MGSRPRRSEQPGKGECSTLPTVGAACGREGSRPPAPAPSGARPRFADPRGLPRSSLPPPSLLRALNLAQKPPSRHFEQYGREEKPVCPCKRYESLSKFPGFS